MKCTAIIKDRHIISEIDMADGVYDIDIKEKDKSRTYEQIKKLWAMIDDISRHEYGDVSQSELIYFQILQMSGIETNKIIIHESAVNDLRKKVRSLRIVSRETISHQPYAVCQVCLKGISEMSKTELSKVIETAVRWCGELGIEIEREKI